MDRAASPHSHNHDLSTPPTTPTRPVIPPKPRSTGSFKLESDADAGRAGTVRSTSSVGTQVNLLIKRRSHESKSDDSQSELKVKVNDLEKKPLGTVSDLEEPKPLVPPCAKPVIPPKPSPALIASPRKISAKSPSLPAKPSESLFINNATEDHSSAKVQSDSYRVQSDFWKIQSDSKGPIQYFGVPDPAQRFAAQRKSASLGRHSLFSPPPLSNFKSSNTHGASSRFSHLDLTSSSQLVSLLLSSQERRSSQPPPPPPRRRSSQKTGSDLSVTVTRYHQSAPVSPSAVGPPVYAVVDKDKKWETRRLRLEKENERLSNSIPAGDMTSEPKAETAPPERQSGLPSEAEPISPLEPISPPEPKSWLGKFILPDDEPHEKLDFILSPEAEPSDHGIGAESDFPSENSSFLFSFESLGSPVPEEVENRETVLTDHGETKVESTDNHENHGETKVESTDNPETKVESTDSREAKTVRFTAAVSEPETVAKPTELEIRAQCNSEKSNLSDTTSEDAEETPKVETVTFDFDSVSEGSLRLRGVSEGSLCVHGVTEGDTSTEVEDPDIDPKGPPDTSDATLIYEIIRSQEQFKCPPKKGGSLESANQEAEGESPSRDWRREKVLPPLITGRSDSFRRRSWTCSEQASSFTESSPTSSSSSSLRERTVSISGSINSHTVGWADEGELSTGALGDAENSEASCQGGSVEDFSPRSIGSTFSTASTFSAASTSSRPKRLVNSIFASFGKGGVHHGHGHGAGRKVTAVRSTPSARRKEKSRSHFFFDAIQVPHGKKSRSEVYLTRENAVRATLDKKFDRSRSAHLPGRSESQSSADVVQSANKHEQFLNPGLIGASTAPEGESGPGKEHGEHGAAPVSLHCYDDILSGLTDNKERQAFYVAREILTSERTFVDVLNLLTVEFPRFVVATEQRLGHSFISKSGLESILGGLPNLKLVNESLIHDLEQRLANWRTVPKVSDIIIKTGPFLKHYSGYIRDYQKLSERFERLCDKNLAFARTVKEFEKSDCCKSLKLKHFMLKPVQRMPQYALLLGDYLKNLDPETSDDYQGTVEAIRIVKEVAQHGNEAIQLQINAEKLLQLQKRLPQNVILKADRQLICEGELRKVCRKELQPRYFALMSDCLLCMTYAGSPTGAGSKELKLRYDLPLTGMRVAIAANEDYQNEFSVISVARSFNLVAKSSKERSEWLKSLNSAIKNNIKKRAGTAAQDVDREQTEIGKVAPVWIADGRVTMCQSCTAEFTMTFRRHHCRACGKVVCSHCSGNEAPLQYLNFEAARVCDDCYTHLMEEFDSENKQNSEDAVETIRNRFKKGTPSISKKGTKHKKSIPTRLEIHGNNAGSAMSGYLNWREGRKAWKKNWFALLDRVLYIYAASEDIAAIRGIPILGYQVELITSSEELEDDDGGKSTFQLTHSGQDPYIFQAENSSSARKWIEAMKEATVMNCDN